MEGTKILEDIRSTIEYSGEIANQLFNELTKNKFNCVKDHHHTVYSRSGLIKLLLLIKLMDFGSVNEALKSDLNILINFGKDVFYAVKNSSNINWRKCLLEQSFKLYNRFSLPENINHESQETCFVIDDTDLPKTGMKFELIGRIFSHLTKKSQLGYKCLNLGIWTGKTLLHIDFSLHGELGKKKNQGMSKKKLKERYSKLRKENSEGQKRINEYF